MIKLIKLFRWKILFNSRTNLITRAYNLNQDFKYVWGMKKSGLNLRKKKHILKLRYIEDGFVHSFGNKKSKIPLSICNDSNGIYYDFSSKSDLFNFISEKLSYKNLSRAKRIIELWKKYAISKYNFPNFLKPPNKPFILLIDQTYGDLSIKYGGADSCSFQKMFDFAINNWPEHNIILKIHPDVINSLKKGYLDKINYSHERVTIFSELGQINNLIQFSTAVCVVTSQIGFEALIYDKEVHVFGKPFYSGLGLTIDHNIPKDYKKNRDVSLEQLVFGSLIKYQNYLDPRTNKTCELEEIMEYIYLIRKKGVIFPNNFCGLFLTPWKARQINRFIYQITSKKVGFLNISRGRIKNFIVWGKSNYLDKNYSQFDNLVSVEDGFIRSVGLGGDLFPPLSLLFDDKGIHYDASKSSRIEFLLQNRIVKDKELIRSKELIKLIKEKNISKYNLGFKKDLSLPDESIKKLKILVLGQVESDNSILYGVPNDTIKKTNFSLVNEVKKDYPNAYIIYKPHPDLEAGLRTSGPKENLISKKVDFVAYQTSLKDIFKKIDRIVVFTSLGGLEGLIRGIPVTTYGLPFYAGWGLTDDKLFNHKWIKRRMRKLSLEELIYISLIEYPFYYSLKFNTLTEIENIIGELQYYRDSKMVLEQNIFKYWGIIKDFVKMKIKK